MIRRPLNPRFIPAILEGRKVTTIRDNAWPVGIPIMFYQWSGAAYRSKQIDVAAVVVKQVEPIIISNSPCGITYTLHAIDGMSLWACEGFDSREDMDAWFAAKIKPGHKVEKRLMRFRLFNTIFNTLPPVAEPCENPESSRLPPPVASSSIPWEDPDWSDLSDEDEPNDEDDYCERCGNQGVINCYCGGDLCCCENQGEMPCPACDP